MHTRDEKQAPEPVDASKGYEASDVEPSGIVVFLTAMSLFIAVLFVVVFYLGRVYFWEMNREARNDYGPKGKWARQTEVKDLGNMPASPDLKDRLAQSTEQFPEPRLEADDGIEAIAQLHAREDVLLEHYTWVDQPGGRVRIPIDRAIEVLARRGLPVVPEAQHEALLTGDEKIEVKRPLTNGFTRTTFEQEEALKTAPAGKE